MATTVLKPLRSVAAFLLLLVLQCDNDSSIKCDISQREFACAFCQLNKTKNICICLCFWLSWVQENTLCQFCGGNICTQRNFIHYTEDNFGVITFSFFFSTGIFGFHRVQHWARRRIVVNEGIYFEFVGFFVMFYVLNETFQLFRCCCCDLVLFA